jgi:predicted secreted protein
MVQVEDGIEGVEDETEEHHEDGVKYVVLFIFLKLIIRSKIDGKMSTSLGMMPSSRTNQKQKYWMVKMRSFSNLHLFQLVQSSFS